MPPDTVRPNLGPFRAGNTGTEGVWQFRGAAEGAAVLITALVHGNEPCGAWALCRVLEAGLRPQRGTLTLAFCNLEAHDRYDPTRPDEARFLDEDLNRVWGPSLATGQPSRERRRARALQPFVEAADWLLDLHSMHEPGLPTVLTGGAASSQRMTMAAEHLGLPGFIVSDAGHAEGARMRDHGRFRDPPVDATYGALLVECGAHGDPASREVAWTAVLRFLDWTEALPAPELARSLAEPRQVLDVTDAVVARSTAFQFVRPWAHGQRVAHAGTLLGWNDGDPVVTPFDDCVLVMPSLRQLRPGVTVVRLARSVTLPTPFPPLSRGAP